MIILTGLRLTFAPFKIERAEQSFDWRPDRRWRFDINRLTGIDPGS